MHAKKVLPIILMVFFTVLMIAGINLGEVPVVLEKAVKICLSCIGIG
ncbi:MAG: CD1871A family CXXC motif-containing protein [Desulfobacterales bacterium]|nr:CD1871A family CXXC motif-containing protein [Desulfobacterales bacterium]MDJ0912614.1 CD1871A family CXXC motif-containing protein [Desulfobacterales bacterium]